MIKHVKIKDCDLYLGDSIQIMKTLIYERTQIHCVISDPPYLLTSGGVKIAEGVKKMSGIFNPKKYNNGGHLVACDIDWTDFMPLFYQMIERGHAYVMSNNRNVRAMLNSAHDTGFHFHNLLVWDKVTATPNRWYMKNCEFTGFFAKGKAKHINDCSSMSCVRMSHTDISNHPTEKPVSLMEFYIRNSTYVEATVIDPFMGSGTTGVAAVNSGRKFIGIEIDENHFNESVRRIEQAYSERQTSIFDIL